MAETPLTRSQLAGLIRLRALLERALREAEDTSEPGRHIALVTLDGACEYAVRLAAHHRGLALKPETSIHAGIDALRSGVSHWEKTGVRGVVEMHAARNQAQHLGLLPDAALMGGWTVKAKAFVETVVEAAFGVRLADVMLADAVRDEEMRGALSEAERRLDLGDYRAAFLYADMALLAARLQWRRQQGGQHPSVEVSPGFSTLPFAGEPLDLLEVQVFAADMSRYTQLLITRHHVESGGPEPDEAEARSALMFAFDWILRWEVFSAGYPSDRYAEYWGGVRSPQLDDSGQPRIAWHIASYRVELGGNYAPQYEMLLQLANLPEEDARDWGLDFSVALTSAEAELACHLSAEFNGINPTGVLRVRVPVSADTEKILRVLSRAVEIATDHHDRRDQDMERAHREALDLRVAYEEIVRSVATTDVVFGHVEVQPELSPTGIRFLVSLSLSVATTNERQKVAAIFRNRGEELAATSIQTGELVFEAFSPEGEALERLRAAIEDSEKEILHRRDIRDKQERELREFSQQIEGALGAAPQTTFEQPGGAGTQD